MANIEWIPVKEKLPEKNCMCLVTCIDDVGDRYTEILWYEYSWPSKSYRWIDHRNNMYINSELIAWSYFELPEPYKEDTND